MTRIGLTGGPRPESGVGQLDALLLQCMRRFGKLNLPQNKVHHRFHGEAPCRGQSTKSPLYLSVYIRLKTFLRPFSKTA